MSDVLILAALQNLTGELEIESGNNIGSMLFHEGRILHSLSPYSRAIGDLLVEDKIITEAELLDALKQQKSLAHIPLGYIILQSGKISFEMIERMVHAQIREAVGEFTSWAGLSFSIVKKEIKPYDKIHLPVYEFISESLVVSAKSFLQEIVAYQSQEKTSLLGTTIGKSI